MVNPKPGRKAVAVPKRRALAVQGPNVLRRTITLPPSLDEQIAAAVGPRNFSAFAQRALLHELQRESIARWLDEREAARGGKPLDAEAIAFADRAWAQRK